MGKFIDVTANDQHEFKAYLATKPGNDRTIVVVQEAFGVNTHIQRVCDRFAENGINAIAPQVFDRVSRDLVLPYTPEGVAKYQEIRKVLRKEDVVRDVVAAADATGDSSVGIVGYCFGGTVAWWAVTESSRFAAASCWYGGGIAEERESRPNAPVQMHFGSNDSHIPLTSVDGIRAAQPAAEIFVYDGAEHGFGCDERPSFHSESNALALRRTIDFFRKNVARQGD
ncbi:MAG: dienelactone hydrolase family protein [Pseudomonadota bacterium]